MSEKTTFTQIAPPIGAFAYQRGQRPPMTFAVLSRFVPNEGNAWEYTLDSLRRFFEQVLTQSTSLASTALPGRPILELAHEDLPANVTEHLGSYLATALLMGQRAAQMHLAFASLADPAFSPEPFSLSYQRSTFETVRAWVFRVFKLLRERLRELAPDAQAAAKIALGREADVVKHLRAFVDRRITAQRIRCHGDFGLESLLHTGKDVIVIDFEGEVLRPLSNRRHKRSPLRDVANMLHSFNSAVRTALRSAHLRPDDQPILEPWARFWQHWVCVAFVKAYLAEAHAGTFLPKSRDEMQIVLDFHLLGRGIFDLRYRLLSQPDEVQIPLQALLYLLDLRDRQLAGMG